MTNHCINLSADEVRACLTGRAVLWRPVCPQPRVSYWDTFPGYEMKLIKISTEHLRFQEVVSDPKMDRNLTNYATSILISPFGAPGDVMIGRETWQTLFFSHDPETGHADDWCTCHWTRYVESIESAPSCSRPSYALVFNADNQWDEHKADRGFAWRSPSTMPASIARIRMEVKAVDVRRTQESDVDQNEWDKRFPQTPWADNPWAWRVEVGK